MKAFHDSHDLKYRSPFGAAPTGSRVTLRIDIFDAVRPDNVNVRVWFDDKETFYPMDISDALTDNGFSCIADITMPNNPGLFWYCFSIDTEEKRYWYLNNTQNYGGIGRLEGSNTGESYQITVYEKTFDTPEWFRGKIMYQIFPDRFYGEHPNGEIKKSREDYIIHYDRYEAISFNKHKYEDGPACNDFYGGNLRGIIAKLPYIKSLGVGVIYLNPIFEAYSNHKYDTADYKKIDAMFGDEENFASLCKEADKLDIKIILDGVFSHTGADSVYFNKYKNYGEGGAYNDETSEFRRWYSFTDGSYDSWWGCSNLPNVNELDPSYLDYIIRDDDSVIKKWLRLGAHGWRLDVADELPDEFIKILRTEVKKVKPDAVIIGEVWEDASNKVAYGNQREYLLGHELDSVMNYPFKDNITAYLMGYKNADETDKSLMKIAENYPTPVRYSLMNLLGTHDTMRIKSLFGGMDAECGDATLPSGVEDLATYRLKCAAFIQMTYIGVPSVYYGDEAGMQGGRDPYNRKPFPWRRADIDLIESVKQLGALRNHFRVLQTGFYKTLYAQDGVWVYARYFENGRDAFGNAVKNSVAICAINRDFEEKHIDIDVSDFKFDNKLYVGISSQKELKIADSTVKISIPPVGYTFVADQKF